MSATADGSSSPPVGVATSFAVARYGEAVYIDSPLGVSR